MVQLCSKMLLNKGYIKGFAIIRYDNIVFFNIINEIIKVLSGPTPNLKPRNWIS